MCLGSLYAQHNFDVYAVEGHLKFLIFQETKNCKRQSAIAYQTEYVLKLVA